MRKQTLYPIWIFFGATLFFAGVILIFELGHPQFQGYWDSLWWSFVSITTTGYGDKVPETVGGRLVAILTMCSGVVMLGLVTGSVASWLVERSLARRRGMGRVKHMKNHFVICGWKREMGRVLKDILRLNPGLRARDVIVLAPVAEEEAEELLQQEGLAELHMLRGEYHTEEALLRAEIGTARKALVLADYSREHTPSEVDSRTVMCVMAIQSLAKGVYIAAEVLDRKYARYLEAIRCDEVLFSREYSRIMLANAAVEVGISHIVSDLLGLDGASQLATRPVPPDLVGQSFGALADHFRGLSEIAIGLLENTGVLRRLREQALREAQKSADISNLIKNLKAAKEIKGNVPVINPGPEYAVPRNALAVVIRPRAATE